MIRKSSNHSAPSLGTPTANGNLFATKDNLVTTNASTLNPTNFSPITQQPPLLPPPAAPSQHPFLKLLLPPPPCGFWS
ncbi:hypothetical protein COP2_010647 [Malus domestica]